MSLHWVATGAASARHVCPVHGAHGSPRCPYCAARLDPSFAIAMPPIVAPLDFGNGAAGFNSAGLAASALAPWANNAGVYS